MSLLAFLPQFADPGAARARILARASGVTRFGLGANLALARRPV